MNILVLTKFVDFLKQLDELFSVDFAESLRDIPHKNYEIIIFDDPEIIIPLSEKFNSVKICYSTAEDLHLFNNVDDFILRPSSLTSINHRIQLWIKKVNNITMSHHESNSIFYSLMTHKLQELSLRITDEVQIGLLGDIIMYTTLINFFQEEHSLVDYYRLYDSLRTSCRMEGKIYLPNLPEELQQKFLYIIILLLSEKPSNIYIDEKYIICKPMILNDIIMDRLGEMAEISQQDLCTMIKIL